MGMVLMVMFALIVMSVPIAYSIGVAAMIGLVEVADISLSVFPQRMFSMLDSFALMAVPYFILAGNLMDYGGISKKLIAFSQTLVGHIKGGLGIVVVISCMMFGAISGSGAAATAAIGGICIPAMVKSGYDKEFASGITAMSGPLGIIIPPSILMVVYATTANVSIGDLFIAGYLPGCLFGLLMITGVVITARRKGYPADKRSSLKDVGRTFVDALWAVFMVVIIMGGILGGVFTATEAACIAVFYALLVGLFVYRELKLKDIPKILVKSALMSSAVMFCIAITNIFAWLMVIEDIPTQVATLMTTYLQGKVMILLAINLIYLILGMIIDGTPAVLLTVPILLPLAQQLGVEPLHYGIIAVSNLAIGMSTPPVGTCLFIATSIGDVPIMKAVRSMLPIWLCMLAAQMVITFVPEISLFLVHLIR